MGLINRDGNEPTPVPEELFRLAESINQIVFEVVALDDDGEFSASFYMMGQVVPRQGEYLTTKAAQRCLVESVEHQLLDVDGQLGAVIVVVVRKVSE